MSEPTRIRVALGARSYDVLVGAGLIDQAGALLESTFRHRKGAPGRQVIVITDPHLAEAGHADRLEASLVASGRQCHRVQVPAGEASKSMRRLETVLDACLALGIERGTLVIALGGGVVGDLGGFAAAVLLRGLDLVQVPTTMLAQVDSAIGGKTGINSRHGKNLIGAFHQPRLVLADTDTLATLPPRELRAGYAEVVKYGLIDRPEFFAWLEECGPGVIGGDVAAQRHAVVESCTAKAGIVATDERETGGRALLNLGHTFAHAYEALTGYGDRLLHGEAVALGLAQAFTLSARLGLCPPADRDRVVAHLCAVGLPSDPRSVRPEGFAPDAMLDAMQRDKKVADGRLRFVLVRGIGQAFVSDQVPLEPLRQTLADGSG